MVFRFFLPLALCLLPFALPWAVPPNPTPTGYVTDKARVLEPVQRQELENQIAAFEKATSIEMTVVIIPDLAGESIETYAITLFSQWRIGKKGKDNGILILMAYHDRQVRIEVGYGLEEILTDGRCGEIIREIMTPHFRAGQYAQGLTGAVTAIGDILAGTSPTPPPAAEEHQPRASWVGILAGSLGLLMFVPFTTIAGIFALFVILSAAGLGRYFALLLIPIGFVLDMIRLTRRRRYGSAWGRSLHGYGGFSGGGFGGGSGGFGGFGGGFSGGGGASGRW